MKIGILTFHRAHNYGAMLQAYALQKTLERYGHQVEFIGYRQECIEKAYNLFRPNLYKNKTIISCIKIFIANILTFRRRYLRHRAFNHFRIKYLQESIPYSKQQLISSTLNYDAVIFGSDQIWTTRFLGCFDDILWGDIRLTRGEKIAYAPSMELRELTIEQQKYIASHLKNFNAISVREITLQHLLGSLTKEKVPVVLDPTLLCPIKEYDAIINNTRRLNKRGKYILIYQIAQHDIVYEIAEYVSKLLKLPIIEISSSVRLHSKSNVYETLGPAHFVSMVQHATFVITSSFHGTAFAINSNIPFYSVLIQGIDSRLRSLLTLLNLNDRGITGLKDIDLSQIISIDYHKVNKALQSERKKSLSFLIDSLSK